MLGRKCEPCRIRQEMIDLLREELHNIRRERDMAMDRLMVVVGRPEATTPALETSIDEPPGPEETRTPAEIEAAAIQADQELIDQIHEQARQELERYAVGKGVPVEALYDA